MAMTMHIDIVSAEEEIYSGTVEAVSELVDRVVADRLGL